MALWVAAIWKRGGSTVGVEMLIYERSDFDMGLNSRSPALEPGFVLLFYAVQPEQVT